jgi:hypothetical protein
MRCALVLAGALLVALVTSGPALAAEAPRSTITTKAPQAELSLQAGNGYSVSVEGKGRTVTLTVSRRLATATYTTRGRATPNGIRARFGGFGAVSVHFVPSGKEGRKGPPRRCDGRPAIVRRGVFVGKIEFEGEDGYVDVDARRAKGRSSTQPRWSCNHGRRGSGAAASRVGYDVAGLKASTPHRRIAFEAAVLDERQGPALSFFVVKTKERKGSVRIARFILAISDGPRAFLFARDGSSASLRPPKPFHGTASYLRNPDGSRSWSGTLSVSLPGAVVDLTGPSFRAKLPPPKTLDDEFEL